MGRTNFLYRVLRFNQFEAKMEPPVLPKALSSQKLKRVKSAECREEM